MFLVNFLVMYILFLWNSTLPCSIIKGVPKILTLINTSMAVNLWGPMVKRTTTSLVWQKSCMTKLNNTCSLVRRTCKRFIQHMLSCPSQFNIFKKCNIFMWQQLNILLSITCTSHPPSPWWLHCDAVPLLRTPPLLWGQLQSPALCLPWGQLRECWEPGHQGVHRWPLWRQQLEDCPPWQWRQQLDQWVGSGRLWYLQCQG